MPGWIPLAMSHRLRSDGAPGGARVRTSRAGRVLQGDQHRGLPPLVIESVEGRDIRRIDAIALSLSRAETRRIATDSSPRRDRLQLAPTRAAWSPTTAASRDRGGNAATGSALGFCRSGRPYGNIPIRGIMGTRGLWRSGQEVSAESVIGLG